MEALVRAAIGFSQQRGDELSLQNVSFQTLPVETPAPLTGVQRTLRIVTPWLGILRYVGVGIFFLVIYLLVLRPVTNQVLATLRALPARSQAAAIPGGTEPAKRPTTVAEIESDLQRELSETNSEVMRSIVLKKHLVEKVKKEPESASRLIQGWVKQTAQET